MDQHWEHAAWHEVHADDLNHYRRQRSGCEITAKAFRTWHATVLAALALAVSQNTADGSRARPGTAVARAVREVSEHLGNTPAVCRASCVDPRIIELYETGTTAAPALGRLGEGGAYGRPATQGFVERAVLELLERD
ncbi:hypothetical protein ACFWBX_03345 [Streptomyces sp. NPDC059991]|uniref:hypothetical protein n=1 Tax=Streptomyces sp. NPDC059991 TaxID=3347028 RepID=UPI0036CA7360